MAFDHYSIVAPNPYIFGLPVRWYGFLIMLGVGVALLLSIREGKKKGISSELLIDLVTFGLPVCIAGARLYFIVFNDFGWYLRNPARIFGFYPSGFGGLAGLAIHGGIIAAVAFAWWYLKKKDVPLLPVLDIVGVGFFVGQMMGRFGNFMNQEAYGSVVPGVDLDAQREFLTSLFIPEFIVNGMFINENYHHPTFLYEVLWNLVGFLIAVFVLRKLSKLLIGEIAAFYAVWYSFGRIFIESLRTDSLMLGDLRVAQVISIAAIVVVLALVAWRRQKEKEMIYYADFNLLDKGQNKASRKQEYLKQQKKQRK